MKPAPAPHGFSAAWVTGHIKDHDTLSPLQLRLAYSCTYLNRRTLREFASIIDAGCGIGYLYRYLEGERWRGRYTGCDSSPASLAAARTTFPGARFLAGDLTALPFAATAADLVYARDTVIHCTAPQEALTELHRIGRHVLLRLRIADVPAVFTARYRDADRVHQWFGLGWLLRFLADLTPTPRVIRYRVQQRTPRRFDSALFLESAPFTHYQAVDVLVMTGDGTTQRTAVVQDAPNPLVGAADRLLGWRNYAAHG